MKTAAAWLRGVLVGSIFAVTAMGEPAENISFAAQTEPPVLTNLHPGSLVDGESARSAARSTPDGESARSAARFTPDEGPSPLIPQSAVDPFPGHTYGNLEDVACLVSLENRGIAYERYGRHTRGVQTPVRLMGPLHGVRFMHAEATDWLASARREILDCRLVLALDDLAGLLARRGITTVLHFGIYRGDLPLPKTGRPLHHVAGLAIDVAMFEKDDGTRIEVRRDWSRRVGPRACGTSDPSQAERPPTAHALPSEETGELHGILCEVVGAKLFHQVLTPNHDAAHRDHFHLEVMRDTEWTLVE